jgi:ABC-2 type transport system permease protein
VRRRLGVLSANPSVDDRLTGRENLRFTGDLFDVPREGLEARIDALLDQFELAGRADERAGGYSTGMRQRLSLARVLLHDPDVLLLDEPTAALDPVAARHVRDLIAGLGERGDRTVVICTHNLVEVQRLCDRIVILEHGRIKATGALPLLFFAGLPLLLGASPTAINLPVNDPGVLLDRLPEAFVAGLPDDPMASLSVLLIVYLLAPLFLVVPLVLAVVAAAGSIAGERERKTLETLLLSPVTDRQLFVAKTAGSWLPAVGVTLVCAVVYQVIGNAVLASTAAVRPFPNLLWALLVVWVAPALAAAALGVVVMISARARTFQDAVQLGGLLVLPLVAMVAAQAVGLVVLGPLSVAVAGAVLWGVAGLLLPMGARKLRRDRLAVRL